MTATELTSPVDEFFSVPLQAEHTVGAARIVTGLADGRSALLVKLHHALGDGMTVLQSLLSDTDDAGRMPWTNRPAPQLGDGGVPGVSADLRPVLSGLRQLTVGGKAPATVTDGPLLDARRHHVLARLPGRAVRTAARTHGVGAAEFLLAAFAWAWRHRRGGRAVRLMVPWSVRGTDSLRWRATTGAVRSISVGPMEFGDRVRLVAATMRAQVDTGVPVAANFVVRLLGMLPLRCIGRRLDDVPGKWFSAIGTVMPGPRREVRWHGAVLSEAYPVLALAPDTGLAWGALTWGPWITVCVTATPDTKSLAVPLAETMTDVVTGSVVREST